MAWKLSSKRKNFEIPLNHELSSRYQCPYAPGQVLENTIGIDAALVCQDTGFWALFQNAPASLYPTHYTPAGFRLNPAYWSELDAALPLFPPIKFNLFLQHKRPDYLTSPWAKEWSQWKGPYYRFRVMAHQQAALEKLANLAGDDALVAYSCAAFHTYAELWQHVGTSSLTTSTNFVAAQAMGGHGRYTFQAAGCAGKAHSEPEEVPHFDLIFEMARRRERRVEGGNLDRLFELAAITDEAVGDDLLRNEYEEQVQRLNSLGNLPESGKAIVRIASFARVTGSSWYFGVAKGLKTSVWPKKP